MTLYLCHYLEQVFFHDLKLLQIKSVTSLPAFAAHQKLLTDDAPFAEDKYPNGKNICLKLEIIC